jgi:hypothetical protein
VQTKPTLAFSCRSIITLIIYKIYFYHLAVEKNQYIYIHDDNKRYILVIAHHALAAETTSNPHESCYYHNLDMPREKEYWIPVPLIVQ